ncbi:MAG TPA: HEAT repeat domain-containing protein [Bacteroidota bacterium]|nr:HEAT repeat domain-containing protein [Bacteroidota bacterium]
MTEEMRKQIATLLADADPDARRSAAEALVSTGDLAVVVPLASALQDENKGVRDAASRSLQSIGGINVARAIVEYIGSENIVTRNLASELLVKLGDTAIPAVLPYLKDQNQDVRKFAVDILGLTRGETPAAALMPMLDDPDENVVVSAIEALGNLRSQEALPGLFGAYARLGFARTAVAEAVGKIGDPSACGFLEGCLSEALGSAAQDPATAFAVIESIGAIGREHAWTLLYGRLEQVKGRLRSAVLHALVQIAQRTGRSLDFSRTLVPDFLTALQDADSGVRMSAAQALARCDARGVTSALIDALERTPDLEPWLMEVLPGRADVFSAAIQYLEEHRAAQVKRTIGLLGKLVGDIAKMIMHVQVDETMERLISRAFILIADRWSTADEETRALIVDVLFRLDGDNAVEFLDAIMNDPDPWLRIHVIEIIAAIADPRAPEFITGFLQDDDTMVREVAADTLQSRGYAVDSPGTEA